MICTFARPQCTMFAISKRYIVLGLGEVKTSDLFQCDSNRAIIVILPGL